MPRLLCVYKDRCTAPIVKVFFLHRELFLYQITTLTPGLPPRFLLPIPIMRSVVCTIVAAILMAFFTIATPIAEPAPNAVADPFQFYGASQTALPIKRDIEKRELRVRRDDIIPEVLLTRSKLVRRTQSPTSGDNANKCSPANAVGETSYTCGSGNDGPCCSINVSLGVAMAILSDLQSNKVSGLVRCQCILLRWWMSVRIWLLCLTHYRTHI